MSLLWLFGQKKSHRLQKSSQLKSSVITIKQFLPVCWFILKLHLFLFSVLLDNYFLSSVTVFTYELPDNQVCFLKLLCSTSRSTTDILVSTFYFLYMFRGISLAHLAQWSKLLHQTTKSNSSNPSRILEGQMPSQLPKDWSIIFKNKIIIYSSKTILCAVATIESKTSLSS